MRRLVGEGYETVRRRREGGERAGQCTCLELAPMSWARYYRVAIKAPDSEQIGTTKMKPELRNFP